MSFAPLMAAEAGSDGPAQSKGGTAEKPKLKRGHSRDVIS